jgi:hypothetical protein
LVKTLFLAADQKAVIKSASEPRFGAKTQLSSWQQSCSPARSLLGRDCLPSRALPRARVCGASRRRQRGSEFGRTRLAPHAGLEFALRAFELSTIEAKVHLGRHVGDQLAADKGP